MPGRQTLWGGRVAVRAATRWLFVAVKGIWRAVAANTGVHASHDLGQVLVSRRQFAPYPLLPLLQGMRGSDVEVGDGGAGAVQGFYFWLGHG